MMSKQHLRSELLAQRLALPTALCTEASIQAQKRVVGLAAFQRAKTIVLYASKANEVQTDLLFDVARHASKTILYPKVAHDTLHYEVVADRTNLISGHYGILEPPVATIATLYDVDVIIVPGVAFDQTGHRLGFGKGYYDRALMQKSPQTLLIGLCHNFQLVDQLPHEAHDIPMDIIVTDHQVVRVRTDRLSD